MPMRNPYSSVVIKRREHPPLRIRCFGCTRDFTLKQAKRWYRSPISRFYGRICCEWCQGGAFNSRHVAFSTHTGYVRISRRVAHGFDQVGQMHYVYLSKLLGRLRDEIRWQTRHPLTALQKGGAP